MPTKKKAPVKRKKKAEFATDSVKVNSCSGSTSPTVNFYLGSVPPKEPDEQFQNNSYSLVIEGHLSPIERIRLQYVIAKELENMDRVVYSTSNKTLRFTTKPDKRDYED